MTQRRFKLLSTVARFGDKYDTADASMQMVQATTVQTTYSPQQRAGLVGMVVDQMDSATATWNNETTAGIPFGVAVSQGAKDGGCVIGGASFLGLSKRDVTLTTVNSDPQSSAVVAVDLYALNTNVAVMSRGRMWVTAGSDVTAGSAVYYDQVTGALSNSASGVSAAGFITFTANPIDASSVTLNGGAPIVFKNVVTLPASQCQIGPTLGDTLVNLATFINANPNADVQIAKFKAVATPASPGGVGQGSGANQVQLGSIAVGVAGNAYTVTTTVVGATASGGTLAGGAANTPTLIVGARWNTSAIVGQLAQVNLSLQT